ncbi:MULTISPECIES: Gfo/Idh/MocA family protein [unclassified Streptosporangium]|uniref:Gfo/Idh/MocA family protein n=1 Tax=unclassified Streptosporangium TaxID=2632669 RepID=UPI002E29AA33|nr:MULTISPECIES: Gfo/Idh/MocA family oxidoreductase [unclassified Streptosporangium]
MRAVIVGCGAIASRWVRILSADPRITIVAVVDPDPAAAERLTARFDLGAVRAPTLLQVLTAHPVDVVVNLTPPEAHAETTLLALDAGLHVLTEKPLATSFADAVRLVHAARRAGRVLAVMQNRGSDPGFLAFRDAVRPHSGPYAVAAEVFVALPSPGFRTRQARPATVDLAVHAFDQVRNLVAAPPAHVACREEPLGFLGEHCAVTTITVTFTDGSTFTYRGGYAGPGLRTPATGAWRLDAPGFAARWDGAATLETTDGAGDAGMRAVSLPDAVPGYQGCITEMLRALHEGAPAVDGSGNLGSIALLDAALASADDGGQPVPVPPTLEFDDASR